MRGDIAALIDARSGHFELESGHHGGRWLELERLARRPDALRPLVAELVDRLSSYRLEAVCGPLVEGAFVALLVASELRVEFSYAQRFVDPEREGLFRVDYRVPDALRPGLEGRRVAVVNDVINAGSAVRGALDDLEALGAAVVAVGALLVLGPAAQVLAERAGVTLVSLDRQENDIWTPDACPLCARGEPLTPHHRYVSGTRASA